MSRVGRRPVPIPKGVQVTVEPGNRVTVKGPLGTLTHTFSPRLTIQVRDGAIVVERASDDGRDRALHGLTRAVLHNMVIGVTQGYQKALEITGVGYRAELRGSTLVLQVGMSYRPEVVPPPGVKLAVEGGNRIVVSGIDKQVVGQVAASIRAIRPADPYKGKGIRYAGEVISLKPGKKAAKK
ncbi:MAG: 50S ribosomal protein L6 [Dehalococcoidia bacterium]|nr:50S ribosomal protein L6 [Dehalococcoidia bacterium]MDW8119296.1 50S ribosomal protein L6 [Chloroflexota bacterium]